MIKQVALLKAHAGLDAAAFADRYEREHAPLVRSLLPYFADYRRSYVVPGTMMSRRAPGGIIADPPFDVVTEIWYEDAGKLRQMAQALDDDRVTDAIARSEEGLFDPAATAIFECEEIVTPGSRLQPRPPGHVGGPAIKLMAFIGKRPEMSRAAFIERYETRHSPLALSVLVRDGVPLFADYRRTFPTHEEGAPPPPGMAQSADIAFDVLTEAWFWNQAHLDHFQAHRADPMIDAIMAEDEEQQFDRASITMFAVDERLSG